MSGTGGVGQAASASRASSRSSSRARSRSPTSSGGGELRPAAREHLHGVLRVAPPVAAFVALRLAERPEPLHSRRRLSHGSGQVIWLGSVPARPRVLEFDVSVDEDGAATSALGGSPLAKEDEWWAEHLVLAGLLRCTLASMGHAAHRAGHRHPRRRERTRNGDEAPRGRAVRVRRHRDDSSTSSSHRFPRPAI